MWHVFIEFISDFQPVTFGLIILAAFSTAVFHAVSGFAGGLLLSICLAPILGIKAVVPVVSVALLFSNSSRAWFFRNAIDWRVYRAIMVTAIPTIIAGAVLYVYLPVAAIAAILGCFLMLSVPLRRVLKKRNFVVSLRGLSVVGSGYGIAAGTVIGAGLLLAPFLLGAGLVGEGLVGMVAALGFTVNIIKTLVFGSSELLTLELVVAGVLIGLCTIPGAYTGRWVVRNTSIRVHTVLVEGMILFGAGYFLYQAWRPLG